MVMKSAPWLLGLCILCEHDVPSLPLVRVGAGGAGSSWGTGRGLEGESE